MGEADGDDFEAMNSRRSRSKSAVVKDTFSYYVQAHGGEDVFGGWRHSMHNKLHRLQTSYDDTQSEDDDDVDSESGSSSPSEEAEEKHKVCGGLRAWNPDLYAWVRKRVGAPQKFVLAMLFIGLDALKIEMGEYAFVDSVNPLSIFILYLSCSLTIALFISFVMEGSAAAPKLLNWHAFWRFFFVAIAFTVANVMLAAAFQTDLSTDLIKMLGYTYLPISAMLSFILFSRHYGRLEWLSMMMLILSMIAFINLRDRCAQNGCHELQLTKEQMNYLGIVFVLISVLASVIASLNAERIYKNKDAGLLLAQGGGHEDRYYIMRVHLDFCQLICMLPLWLAPSDVGKALLGASGVQHGYTDAWFGQYTRRHFVLIFVLVAQSWMAGVVVKRFSTVIKAIMQNLSTVFVLLFSDWFQNKYGMEQRRVPAVFITLIIVFSALIFQTGRINLKAVREALGIGKPQVLVASWQALSDVFRSPTNQMAGSLAEFPQEEEPAQKRSVLAMICSYSVVIAYILADSFRTVLMSVVQSNRFIVPQTIQVATAFCGLALASVLVVQNHGMEGLRAAWEPRKIRKFLMTGFLQALTGTLTSLSFALGISPALSVALGKIYTLEAALMSRWVLGKFYLWLEWFALIILTLASITFGLLDSLGSAETKGAGGGYMAVACVIGGATSSCLMSLVMEKLMKTETEPFIMQKVRLDFGSLIFSALFWPIMGYLGVIGGRPDLAFWTYRANSYVCESSYGQSPACSNTGIYLPKNDSITLAEEAGCYCANGVFVGWGVNWVIYLSLAVTVFHSWVTGMVVKQFSSVYRAIADGFPLVLIYFLLDPLCSRIPLQPFRDAYWTGPLSFPPGNWAKDFIAPVIPLSGITFSFAGSEMEKITKLGNEMHNNSNNEETFDGEDEDGEESESEAAGNRR